MSRLRTIIASLTLISPLAANASLIGDTVTLAHEFAGAPICGSPIDVVVQAGAGDVAEPYQCFGGGWYFVDVEADSFSVLYGRSPSWGSTSFNGLIVSDLDWVGASGSIVDVSFTTNLLGFDPGRVSFTADSVSINWQGLGFAAGTRWDVDLITSHDVPAPATLGLLGLGLLGLRLRRKS